VIIDGDSLLLLRPGKEKSLYTLAENLPAGKHTVELFRRTEWDRGYTAFYGFELPAGSKVLAKDKPTKLKIEFYGNSITAGYAVDDAEPNDRPDSTFTNFYHSYAYVTAKSLNADYQATCKSGIGILISWFPTIMPQIYDRVNPYDSLSKWDFKKFQADVVVLNLFQNDSWLIHKPERPEFQTFLGGKEPTKDEIIAAYKSFVAKLRAKYPKAKIVCMLGNMDITREGSPWPGYVKEAVSQMADKSIYTFFEPAKSTGGHPRADEQALMAKHLTEFISGLK
jgi:hypothetical protein